MNPENCRERIEREMGQMETEEKLWKGPGRECEVKDTRLVTDARDGDARVLTCDWRSGHFLVSRAEAY